MKQLGSTVERLAPATAYILMMSLTSMTARADLTGPQVMARCQQAYKSLRSYRGTTHALTKSSISGIKSTYNTMATVQFVRPGKIRVDGTLMVSGRFAFVSDGAHTWQTSIGDPGKWELAQSTEMAIAAFTGVSQSAATTIPAILVGTRWGYPFGASGLGKVTRETIHGRMAYRIERRDTQGQATFWIDSKTFLFVKIHQRHDLSHLRAQIPKDLNLPQGLPNSGVMDVTQTFTDVQVNVPIPASTFTRPPGAPQ